MWNSINKFGLSDEEIQVIKEKLWEESKAEASRPCPDCGVSPGKIHLNGCDVARCPECGGQMLSCGCDKWGDSEWSGMWPGYEDCYVFGLICCWGDTKEWRWDLNELAIRK